MITSLVDCFEGSLGFALLRESSIDYNLSCMGLRAGVSFIYKPVTFHLEYITDFYAFVCGEKKDLSYIIALTISVNLE